MLLEEGRDAVLAEVLFPGVAGVRVDRLWREGATLHVAATTTRRRARCPDCGRRSRRVHSRYERVMADVPCGGAGVRLHVRPRRFWCRVRGCRRRIFCERLPDLAAPRARRTARLRERLRRAAGALGGEAAARQAAADGTPVSARTLLRLLRDTPLPEVGPVRVLGVDDWSRRRGQAFGAILVDLEAHRVLDLLPDRTAATLAAWLRPHPELEVVEPRPGRGLRRRDPAGRPPGRAGGRPLPPRREPDRRGRAHARPAPRGLARRGPGGAGRTGGAPPPASVPERPTKLHRERLSRRERRRARYEEVLGVHRRGWSQVRIADALGMGRHTVRRYLRADGCPEPAPAAPRPERPAPL